MKKEDIKFSKNLFWDIRVDELDIDEYPRFVLKRVLEYGKWEDWVQIRAYYPMELIKQEAMQMRTLFPQALRYIATYTNTKKEDYRCYQLAKINPNPWNFDLDLEGIPDEVVALNWEENRKRITEVNKL